ncbi:MAG: hypothetical protein OJF49_003169 [Ktedonobacterales bacterium]|jgi:hypothetical protein|nr:MAG: hypothetical protein OJF49_003169 [Ktedonobacterales bacterium]
MPKLTIVVSDTQWAWLQDLARQRGQTVEQAAEAILNDLMDPEHRQPPRAAEETRGIASALDLVGLVDDPAITPLTAEEMDQLLTREAISTHDDYPC